MDVGAATGCDCGSASVSCRFPSGSACCCSCNEKRKMSGEGSRSRKASRGRSYCLRGERERDLERDLERLLLLLLLPIFTSFLSLEDRGRVSISLRRCGGAGVLPVVRTLADLGAVVGLLLDSFGGGGVGGLLLHLDYVWRAGLGGGGKAPDGERGGPVWVEALGLQLGLRQEHLSPLHLLLQLVVVGLRGARSKG